MFSGEFYPRDSNFGVFMDSCPDRWGQILMRRREALDAKEEGRAPITLDSWDFLIGIQDCTRIGALRYSPPEEQLFLADEALAAPPIARLEELQSIAFEITRKQDVSNDVLREWLKVLVAPGASLGGARPKANILDKKGHLWIAKFPSADDDNNVALWEKLVHDLARDCDISVPDSTIVKLGTGHSTFLVKRFDRDGDSRVFYSSAMTLLNRTDSEEACYLELAEFISTHGSRDKIDNNLSELFTRVVFNVVTANRDDHLRNHGFIMKPSGWELAPAFDMNPSFKKADHVLAIDTDRHEPDLRAVIETSPFYRLDEDSAYEIVEKVLKAVADWKRRAIKLGLSRSECSEAEHLFRLGI
jgi:serine/threonine-protein kinase HipA